MSLRIGINISYVCLDIKLDCPIRVGIVIPFPPELIGFQPEIHIDLCRAVTGNFLFRRLIELIILRDRNIARHGVCLQHLGSGTCKSLIGTRTIP